MATWPRPRVAGPGVVAGSALTIMEGWRKVNVADRGAPRFQLTALPASGMVRAHSRRPRDNEPPPGTRVACPLGCDRGAGRSTSASASRPRAPFVIAVVGPERWASFEA